MRSKKESNELLSGQEIGKARMLQSEESRAKPFYKFLGEEKVKKKTQL
jgi:hypothetical protein